MRWFCYFLGLLPDYLNSVHSLSFSRWLIRHPQERTRKYLHFVTFRFRSFRKRCLHKPNFRKSNEMGNTSQKSDSVYLLTRTFSFRRILVFTLMLETNSVYTMVWNTEESPTKPHFILLHTNWQTEKISASTLFPWERGPGKELSWMDISQLIGVSSWKIILIGLAKNWRPPSHSFLLKTHCPNALEDLDKFVVIERRSPGKHIVIPKLNLVRHEEKKILPAFKSLHHTYSQRKKCCSFTWRQPEITPLSLYKRSWFFIATFAKEGRSKE